MPRSLSLALAGWFAVGTAGVLCSAITTHAPHLDHIDADSGPSATRALGPVFVPRQTNPPHPGPPAPTTAASLAAIALAVSRRRS